MLRSENIPDSASAMLDFFRSVHKYDNFIIDFLFQYIHFCFFQICDCGHQLTVTMVHPEKKFIEIHSFPGEE